MSIAWSRRWRHVGTGRAQAVMQRIDPSWPRPVDGGLPVSELCAPVPGALSPFGDIELPAAQVPYDHPIVEIHC